MVLSNSTAAASRTSAAAALIMKRNMAALRLTTMSRGRSPAARLPSRIFTPPKSSSPAAHLTIIKTNGDRKLADLLAEGAAYYGASDNQAVTNDSVNKLENVKVVSHTHNGGTDGKGICSVCKQADGGVADRRRQDELVHGLCHCHRGGERGGR